MFSVTSKGVDIRCCELSDEEVVDCTEVVCQCLGANISVDIDVIVSVSVNVSGVLSVCQTSKVET